MSRLDDTSNSLIEEDEEQRMARRHLAEAIHFSHEYQLRSGYARLVANVRRQTVIAGHANLGIADKGEYYRQQRLRSLSKGLKSLWGNTEQQKKEMAVEYHRNRKASLVFGAWMNAAHEWKKDDIEAEETATLFGEHFLKIRGLLNWMNVSRREQKSSNDHKLSTILAYLMSVKRGFAALRRFRERCKAAKAGERSEQIYTAGEITLQRYMSSWFQYWKTRRVHSDLLLYHFAPLAREALTEWRSNVQRAFTREVRADGSTQVATAGDVTRKRKSAFRRLRQAVSRRAVGTALERADLSSFDELLVRRVVGALRDRVQLTQRHFALTRRGVRGGIIFQAKAALRRLRSLTIPRTSTSTSTSTARGAREEEAAGADHMIGRAREAGIATFAAREAKKRSLLQWLRLLTRSIVSRDAYTATFDYLQWRRPFCRKSRAFLQWARRVAAVKIHRRRGSFAALGLYSRRARLAFAGLASRRAYMHQMEGPSLRRATFHRDTRAQRKAFALLHARAGAPRARSRGLRVRSVMFLKLWHCAKAVYNWHLHVHKRRDRRLRWACAQQRFTEDQAMLAARFWIRAAYPAHSAATAGAGAGAGAGAAGAGANEEGRVGAFGGERQRRLAGWVARRWRLFAWKSRLARAGQLPATEASVRGAFLSYLYKASHASSLLASHRDRAAAVQCKYASLPAPAPASAPNPALEAQAQHDAPSRRQHEAAAEAEAEAEGQGQGQGRGEGEGEGGVPLHRAKPRTRVFEAYVGAVSPAFYSPSHKARGGGPEAAQTHRYYHQGEGGEEEGEEEGEEDEQGEGAALHLQRSPDSVAHFPSAPVPVPGPGPVPAPGGSAPGPGPVPAPGPASAPAPDGGGPGPARSGVDSGESVSVSVLLGATDGLPPAPAPAPALHKQQQQQQEQEEEGRPGPRDSGLRGAAAGEMTLWSVYNGSCYRCRGNDAMVGIVAIYR